MRHLIDAYVKADESQKISAFDDMTLIDLIVDRGVDAIQELPKNIRKNKEAVGETIENNVRKLITDESPINPKYYEHMSELLNTLIEKRRKSAINYEQYLAEIVDLAKRCKNPDFKGSYPSTINTSAARRALYDNLDKNEELACQLDEAIRHKKKDDWRGNNMKERELKITIKNILNDDGLSEKIFEIVRNQDEY